MTPFSKLKIHFCTTPSPIIQVDFVPRQLNRFPCTSQVDIVEKTMTMTKKFENTLKEGPQRLVRFEFKNDLVISCCMIHALYSLSTSVLKVTAFLSFVVCPGQIYWTPRKNGNIPLETGTRRKDKSNHSALKITN